MTGDLASPIFQIRGVVKRFDGEAVLDGLDLDLGRGETLALIGASGCGKTVLLKCMIRLVAIDEGEILFDGRDVAAMDRAALTDMRRRVGLMFQQNALFDSMTVSDNVAYGLHELIAGRLDDDEVRARVAWALECVGLAGTESLLPEELSGGMRKRVGLARTMALRPEVVLYDEPTMGLDPINAHRIGSLIDSLHAAHDITSLMVTHDMKLARTVCDRIALIVDGRVAATDTPEAMAEHPDERVRDFLLGIDRETDVSLNTP